jgi:hypothetical protein
MILAVVYATGCITPSAPFRFNNNSISISVSLLSSQLAMLHPSDDPYRILGISRIASPKDIKAAYRRAALQHHPDRQNKTSCPDFTHDTFTKINNAYQILSDEDARREYDKERTGQLVADLIASGLILGKTVATNLSLLLITASRVAKRSLKLLQSNLLKPRLSFYTIGFSPTRYLSSMSAPSLGVMYQATSLLMTRDYHHMLSFAFVF